MPRIGKFDLLQGSVNRCGSPFEHSDKLCHICCVLSWSRRFWHFFYMKFGARIGSARIRLLCSFC